MCIWAEGRFINVVCYMLYGEHMAKVRTTLVLEEDVFQKLKQEAEDNISEFVNRLLKKELFETRKDMVEDED